ncbi:hypothetical protein OUZ56_002775 [Daphnia magna]|uniref:Uncharacterized protein n=1 Tax=Daphnia magna TaxID=35525 RepID=A0ABR0A774_9CRUS|nr:hypothetical protein OUZ56_002775 [Daphnia magna]
MIKTRVTSSSQLLKKIAGFTFMLDNYLKNENYNLDLGERVKSFAPMCPEMLSVQENADHNLNLAGRLFTVTATAMSHISFKKRGTVLPPSLAISACWLMLAKHMRNCLLIQERPTIHAQH